MQHKSLLWLAINFSTVTNLNHQHTHFAILDTADHSNITHTITPIST